MGTGLRTGGLDKYRHQHIMGSSYSSEDERRKSGARQKAPIEIAIDVAFTQEHFGQRWCWTSGDALISPDVANPASIAEVNDLRSGLCHSRRVILGANVTKRADSDWSECPNFEATFRPGVIFCPTCGYEEDSAQNKHLNKWAQQLVREDLDSDYGSFAPRERNPKPDGTYRADQTFVGLQAREIKKRDSRARKAPLLGSFGSLGQKPHLSSTMRRGGSRAGS